MLGKAMDNVPSPASDTSTGPSERDYPDKLDAALLRVAGLCGLASVMAVLDSTVVSVAQRTFIADFGSTQAVVGWTIAGYMLAFATVIPITGWAADRFGTKRLFIASVLIFTLGSLLCAMAPTILLLIVFRMVQGAGGGMLVPLSFAVITREAGPRRLGRLVAVGGIPMLIGPIGGPILGGWLIGAYGWKWIFLINVPIGLLVVGLALIFFPRERPTSAEPFDVVGVLLLSPGLVILLFGISSISVRGTIADRYVVVPVIVGVALIAAFVAHALHRTDHPLINLRLFRNRVLTQANVTMLVYTTAIFGSLLLFPSYFQLVQHKTPIESAIYMLPQGIGAMSTMPIAGLLMDKRGAGRVALVGIPLMAVGLGIVSYGVSTQAAYVPTLVIGLAIIGMGMGASMTPLTAVSVQTLAPQQIARGSTLISVNQQVGGSVGTALMSMVLTTQFKRSENIVAANKLGLLKPKAAGGAPASDIPWESLPPSFAANVLHDLSHAFTTVFVIAMVLVALVIIPASFLPKGPAVPVDVD
jgi:MFS transporter, DHA2 family, multidrug resistance protein